jgi:hypothetical protein
LKSLHEYSSVKAVLLGMGMLGLSTIPGHAQSATDSNITVQYHVHREEALPVHGNALSKGEAVSN